MRQPSSVCDGRTPAVCVWLNFLFRLTFSRARRFDCFGLIPLSRRPAATAYRLLMHTCICSSLEESSFYYKTNHTEEGTRTHHHHIYNTTTLLQPITHTTARFITHTHRFIPSKICTRGVSSTTTSIRSIARAHLAPQAKTVHYSFGTYTRS